MTNSSLSFFALCIKFSSSTHRITPLQPPGDYLDSREQRCIIRKLQTALESSPQLLVAVLHVISARFRKHRDASRGTLRWKAAARASLWISQASKASTNLFKEKCFFIGTRSPADLQYIFKPSPKKKLLIQIAQLFLWLFCLFYMCVFFWFFLFYMFELFKPL